MTLLYYLILFISLAVAVVGSLFLLFPYKVTKLEEMLNASWGGREITAIRFGLPGEQSIEHTLNRNVLEKRITWDGWSRNHPRLTGLILCSVAALVWLAILLW